MKISILIQITIIILLSGCATQNRCARKFPPQVKTETITEKETVYRDTTIYIQVAGDTIRLTDTIYVTEGETGLKTPISTLNVQFAVSRAWVEGGRLRHELDQKETEIERVIKNAVREQSTHTVETKIETHEVRFIPTWAKILFGLVIGLGLIGWLRR